MVAVGEMAVALVGSQIEEGCIHGMRSGGGGG